MALSPPSRPLSDGAVRLRPLRRDDEAGFARLAADAEVRRFTRVPADPPAGFAAAWLERYLTGWEAGALGGFAIELGDAPLWGGFAGIVAYDPGAAEGELGYIVAPGARGRGAAARALRLLTAWALGPAGLQRAELMIDVDNGPSLRVAERVGFVREGVRRSTAVTAGRRADVSIWSMLADEVGRLAAGGPPPRA